LRRVTKATRSTRVYVRRVTTKHLFAVYIINTTNIVVGAARLCTAYDFNDMQSYGDQQDKCDTE